MPMTEGLLERAATKMSEAESLVRQHFMRDGRLDAEEIRVLRVVTGAQDQVEHAAAANRAAISLMRNGFTRHSTDVLRDGAEAFALAAD